MSIFRKLFMKHDSEDSSLDPGRTSSKQKNLVVVVFPQKLQGHGPDGKAIQEKLMKLVLSAATDKIIIDLSQNDFLDSAALGMMEIARRECITRGVRMVLAGVHGKILELFQIIRLDKVYTIYDSVAAAEDS